MLKTGILHPQLARVLAELRHKDTIIIGDAGLPIPKGVERVDLGWRPGDPAYLDVLEEILKYIVVEGAVFADERSPCAGFPQKGAGPSAPGASGGIHSPHRA